MPMAFMLFIVFALLSMAASTMVAPLLIFPDFDSPKEFVYSLWEIIKNLYLFGIVNAVCVYAFLDVQELLLTLRTRSNEYLAGFYKPAIKTIMLNVVTGACLFAVFWTANAKYSFSSVDIAAFSIPFFLSSLWHLGEIWKYTFAGKRLLLMSLGMWIMITIISLLVSLHLMRIILTGTYPDYKSIYIQIVIVLAAFAIEQEAGRIKYFVKHGRVEPPIFKMETLLRAGNLISFAGMSMVEAMYSDLTKGTEQINKEVKDHKTQKRIERNRKNRRRRRKGRR